MPCGPSCTIPGGARSTLVNARSENQEGALLFLEYLHSAEWNNLINQQADALAPVIEYNYTEDFLYNPDHPEEDYNDVWRTALENSVPEDISPYINGQKVERILLKQTDLVRAGGKSGPAAMKTARGSHLASLTASAGSRFAGAIQSGPRRGGSARLGQRGRGPMVNRARQVRSTVIALLFLAPNFFGFCAFTLGPVVFSFVVAFTNWNLIRTIPLQWVWFDNFIALFSEQEFWLYFINTGYLMLGIPISIAGSLFLAVLLSQRLKGIVVYRTLLYLQSFTVGVALFILWKKLYNSDFGPINHVLEYLVHSLGWTSYQAPR